MIILPFDKKTYKDSSFIGWINSKFIRRKVLTFPECLNSGGGWWGEDQKKLSRVA
jgi:hypothetical protein